MNVVGMQRYACTEQRGKMKQSIKKNIKKIVGFFRAVYSFIYFYLRSDVYFGREMSNLPYHSIVFFPCRRNIFFCGLAGIVAFKKKKENFKKFDPIFLNNLVQEIERQGFNFFSKDLSALYEHYLGGKNCVDLLFRTISGLKGKELFAEIFTDNEIQDQLSKVAGRLNDIVNTEEKLLNGKTGYLEAYQAEIMSDRIEKIKDIKWCISSEILNNIIKIKELSNHESNHGGKSLSFHSIDILAQINQLLNSIDYLEVRGRDSAGISLMFVFDETEFENFKELLQNFGDENLYDQMKRRSKPDILVNANIRMHGSGDEEGNRLVAVTMTYKIASEIGSLGNNAAFLRSQIKNDPILQKIIRFPFRYHTITSHTRWASVGAISEPNCHPVDNVVENSGMQESGIIHACLNGDIDNYLQLKEELEKGGSLIHKEVTTDTKIIPLYIEKYVREGFDIEDAFRLAVNNFEGSHAISMHTDLAPGKIFLAQRGSGQAVFLGLSEDYYIPASEIYGFVEKTPYYIKMDGEKVVEGGNGTSSGQIFVLNQKSSGGLSGIKACFYDGTPVELSEKEIKRTDITSRDIHRQEFPHYFLKEISESPVSVEKTLQNRWKVLDNEKKELAIVLDEKTVPDSLKIALTGNKIQRIFFIGQGTAGVAALACANILNYYMNDPSIQISSLKSSELSGFNLTEDEDEKSMSDTLVIAISQSGTTTDTNRAIEMLKTRGAGTLAIVNRRDSDITFKVDGVFYTSSGRDIEMSVASTKAFYSQIVAGAILSLYIAGLKEKRKADFITREINQLLEIPGHMRKVLNLKDKIEYCAKRLAATKIYWAVVGSGPNKASADEIRIKLSELCYKTISSDFIEDKKHIDLSSEPLIIVCAAGTNGNVIGDIIKDTAIFHAHKATPVVIANEGEEGFIPYAKDVFYVPIVSQHLSPVLNTLVGHIWGYYAALAINEGSIFLHNFREDIQKTIDNYAEKGLDIFEAVLEKSFREKIVSFYSEFRSKRAENSFPAAIAFASDITLLLKYLSGKLPVSDFELDFGKKGTALNMLSTLFEYIGKSINSMSRPVDAIKHQAKTVTVGTSRISKDVEGILFEKLEAANISLSQLINKNVIVLKNLQRIIAGIKGSILYKISGLNLLGEPTSHTKIEVIKKDGELFSIPSRVETDTRLKGTKYIIVQQGNVYIGKGRKDDRSIIVIPAISASPPNFIEYLLLLNISFRDDVPLSAKIKALGGKFEHIKNIVMENSIPWYDGAIDLVEIEELFGRSAEKIGEKLVSLIRKEKQMVYGL